MGRDIWVSGQRVFYIVGWASPHFEEFSGLKIHKAIPLILTKLRKMYDHIFDNITNGNPIPLPPYEEESSGGGRNGNWWFGIHEDGRTPFSNDMKTVVVYHTLLEFMVVMSHQNQSKRIIIEDMYSQNDTDNDESGTETEEDDVTESDEDETEE